MLKPILFNTDMVRAILDGRKTETRRPIKPQPNGQLKCVIPHETKGMSCWMVPGADQLAPDCKFHKTYEVGDILYVRETWKYYEKAVGKGEGFRIKQFLAYKADEYNDSIQKSSEWYEGKWRPSIHMPKEAARIFLKVTEVRVERVQDITEEMAMTEGIRGWTKDGNLYKYGHIEPGDNNSTPWVNMPRTAAEAYRNLWDGVYKNWSENPWVWVIKFEKNESLPTSEHQELISL